MPSSDVGRTESFGSAMIASICFAFAAFFAKEMNSRAGPSPTIPGIKSVQFLYPAKLAITCSAFAGCFPQ